VKENPYADVRNSLVLQIAANSLSDENATEADTLKMFSRNIGGLGNALAAFAMLDRLEEAA
jgi:hypothetical protein